MNQPSPAAPASPANPAPQRLELVAPAKNADFGIAAIDHGADAVYIGGPAFGARAQAGNQIADVARLCAYAGRYRARVLLAVNTILRDDEIESARRLAWQAWDAGVDALIVQDMGLLEVDLPPLPLHASTQCDIRSAAKAQFLARVGFSQLVLARELDLAQIAAIRQATAHDAVSLEFFVHGALCVAFSGQCYISHAQSGRSANRGDCAQNCRLPYTLHDQAGGVVSFEKHLLSMKDNDQTANLAALIDAGISSFKIEGRYKDLAYVKNITGHYRRALDAIIERRPGWRAAASGSCRLFFTPNADKTFNRANTDYFVRGRQIDIGAFDSPKFLGLPLGEVSKVGKKEIEIVSEAPLANGDGLNYLHKREVVGFQVNTATPLGQSGKRWRVTCSVPCAELPGLRPGVRLNRNGDRAFAAALNKKSAERRIALDMRLGESASGFTLSLTDEDGVSASADLVAEKQPARDPAQAEAALRSGLARLGDSSFHPANIAIDLAAPWFIAASAINDLRRRAVAALEERRQQTAPRRHRKPAVEPPAPYPESSLSYLGNVYNAKARQFYARHGVALVDAAFEANRTEGEVALMITKHCLRFSFNLCPKQAKGVTGVQGQVRAEPMLLRGDRETYRLVFDCRACEMHVIGQVKKSASPGTTTSAAPGKAR